MKLIALALVLASVSAAQTPASETTNSKHNGRWWKQLEHREKIIFLMGLNEGAVLVGKNEDVGLVFTDRASYGEMTTYLDQFFTEPTNAALPVPDGLIIFIMKLNGSTPEDLERATAKLRELELKAVKQ